MKTISIEEAQRRLPELVAFLRKGDECIITHHNLPIARLIKDSSDPQNFAGSSDISDENLDHHMADLEDRIAALEDLGPVEYEPGEEQEIRRALRNMDDASREAVRKLMGGP